MRFNPTGVFSYFKDINKNITYILLMLVVAIGSEQVQAQAHLTSSSWHYPVNQPRIISLGQATAVLNNQSRFHANPAIPANVGEITVSGFLPSSPLYNKNVNLYSPSVIYGRGKWSYSAAIDYTRFESISQPGFNKRFHPYNRILRLNAGYRINEYTHIGAGVSHYYRHYGRLVSGENAGMNNEASALGFSLGGYVISPSFRLLQRIHPTNPIFTPGSIPRSLKVKKL